MYSKYSSSSDPIKIPEHYSGCAFSTPKSTPVPPKRSSALLEVGKPSPTVSSVPPLKPVTVPAEEPKEETTVSETEESKPIDPDKEKAVAVSSPFSSLFGNIGSAFPFSHGIGFEELLILGLIILLSRNEEESDVVLLLGLLLFCG